jgi:DNA polymerase III delta subunit
MDHGAFVKLVERGDLPPVLLLAGPEPLLLDDALARVTRALFPEGADATLSREVLEAREAGAEAIARSALTMPFLAPRRLVAVRGAEGLGPKQAEPLVAYVAAPNPATVLLFLVEQDLPGSHWLARAVPAAGVVSLPRPVGRAVVSWLRARAAADGLELGEDAASLLVQLVGDDLTTLCGEVEKAAVAGGAQNRRVTVNEVRAVVGEHRLRHVFDLTRALERRDRAGALAVLGQLLNAGEEPLALLGMIVRETRAVWQASDALRRGRPADEIGRALRRPPAGVAAVMTLAQSTPAEAARRRLELCWDVERRLKSGGAPRAELALLVSELCAPFPRPAASFGPNG